MQIDYDQEINILKSNLDKARNLRIRAEVRLEQLSKQKDEILKELDQMHVRPEELDDTISKLDTEIKELIEISKKLIPVDLIHHSL